MFKTILSFVDPETGPEFLLMCDNRTCAFTARGPAKVDDDATVQASQVEFLKAATGHGWIVGLDAQFCPGHASQQRAMAKANRDKLAGGGLLKPNISQIASLSKTRQ